MNFTMIQEIFKSWKETEITKYSMEYLLDWIFNCNESIKVNIRPNKLSDSCYWIYDNEQECIRTVDNSFFSILGLKAYQNGSQIAEQPIILQEEIGYLGILCTKIKGTLHFLMQAKIEPGNINKVQISPTIQATKSNFLQKHGGRKPYYLEYFLNASVDNVLVDQIQSEQSSRFYKKRNRNIIIYIDREIPEMSNYRWMTLGQIKQLMKIDNIVNMDTRTVLSCIPTSLYNDIPDNIINYFSDITLYNSMFCREDSNKQIVELFTNINNYKMFGSVECALVGLNELSTWKVQDNKISCINPYNFYVMFCDIEVEGREVRNWTQPLFCAEGIATFGLYTCIIDGRRQFLVHLKAEHGCFDRIEIGPTVQREYIDTSKKDEVESKFFEQYNTKTAVVFDALLSEEGGRFYHEQNRNIILETSYFEPIEGYHWISYYTLNLMNQFNNCLNIQLRNLLSLLQI